MTVIKTLENIGRVRVKAELSPLSTVKPHLLGQEACKEKRQSGRSSSDCSWEAGAWLHVWSREEKAELDSSASVMEMI